VDDVKVAELAARHRALAVALKSRAGRLVVPVSDRALHEQVEACWNDLRSECTAFCGAYNQAFAEERVYCQAHADAIVVRASDDPQETLALTRNLGRTSECTHLSAHRYSSHAPPEAIPLEMRVVDAHVALILDGRSTPAAEVVLCVLGQFTEELVGRLSASS
jgi:hypothetical protein